MIKNEKERYLFYWLLALANFYMGWLFSRQDIFKEGILMWGALIFVLIYWSFFCWLAYESQKPKKRGIG